MEEANAKAADYKEAMGKAMTAADPEEYETARAEYDKATQAAELYARMLDGLKNRPLAMEDEAAEAIKAIKGEIARADDEAMAKLAPLVEQMKQIADELDSTIKEGHRVLHKWRLDVLRQDTNTIIGAERIESFRDFDAVTWARKPAESGFYQKYKEEHAD